VSESHRGESGPGAPRLPPGQKVARGWPVLHYGPVPKSRPESWDFRVFGATEAEEDALLDLDAFRALGKAEVVADLHCVTKFSVLDRAWSGVPGAALLAAVPPVAHATHALVWAEYGYGANLRLSDLAAGTTLFATGVDGEPLTPERGAPVRLVVPHLYAWKGPKWVRGVEYLTEDRRGFWEERGYHNRADPWDEQRYSYQENAGDGPAL
jgi:DMSO/TMAO reductase YedYZ molybdopterin-dependent catalytic subunit